MGGRVGRGEVAGLPVGAEVMGGRVGGKLMGCRVVGYGVVGGDAVEATGLSTVPISVSSWTAGVRLGL